MLYILYMYICFLYIQNTLLYGICPAPPVCANSCGNNSGNYHEPYAKRARFLLNRFVNRRQCHAHSILIQFRTHFAKTKKGMPHISFTSITQRNSNTKLTALHEIVLKASPVGGGKQSSKRWRGGVGGVELRPNISWKFHAQVYRHGKCQQRVPCCVCVCATYG